jgi:alkyl hydroperoxide reductase subunit AhpC
MNFPVIADADRKVADLCGMVRPGAGPSTTMRSVFIIGPKTKV